MYELDHVAIAVFRMIDAMPLVAELGGEPVDGGPGVGFVGAQWRFAGGGRLEVLEPAGPSGGFLHRFLDARGPGVHHVTFKVPNLGAAAARARELGYSVVGFDDSNPRWKEAFLHPKSASGIVVQFAESHPELGEGGDWSADFPFPTSPPRATPAVTLVGIRLSVRRDEHALRLWSELLGGDATRDDRERYVFRWPKAPLRVAVEVARERVEGPIGIEIATDREIAPHPEIGTELIRLSGY